MKNDTIIEEMRVWTHNEIDKALDKARAEERAKVLDEVKMLIAERLKMECKMESCDDCLECCEVTSLMWVDDRLGIPTNNNFKEKENK